MTAIAAHRVVIRLAALTILVATAGCTGGYRLALVPVEPRNDTAEMSTAPENSRLSGPVAAVAVPLPEMDGNRAREVNFGGGSSFAQGTGASRIGVFGEFANYRPATDGLTDGASNIQQITTATEGGCFDPEMSPDGRFIAFTSTMHAPTSDLYVRPVNGRTLTQLTSDPADDVMPTLSPDQKRIAFASNRSGNWDIYVMSVEGGQTIQLTTDSADELHPTWSPDGRTIAYCRLNSRDDWEMWTVNLENTSSRNFIEYGLFPQWCPDAARSKILFQRPRQTGSRFFSIWTVDYVGGEAKFPTEIVSAGNAAVMHPSWSPDGSRIAFVTAVNPDAQNSSVEYSDVWIINLDGSGRVSLTNGEHSNIQPTWGPDGRVFFISNRSGVENIWAVGTDTALELSPRGGEPSSIVGVPSNGDGMP